jgi:hypothetical protein
MASVTIKNVPERLLGRLRKRARNERRSLNKQIIHLLEASLEQDPGQDHARTDARKQVEAWRRLAGRWKSDMTAEEEIRSIRKARSPSRKPKR